MSNKILKKSTIILAASYLSFLTNIHTCEAMDWGNDERQNIARTARGSGRGGERIQENDGWQNVGKKVGMALGSGGVCLFLAQLGKGEVIERASEACRVTCSSYNFLCQIAEPFYRRICTSTIYDAVSPKVEKGVEMGVGLVMCALPVAYVGMRKISSIFQRCWRPTAED